MIIDVWPIPVSTIYATQSDEEVYVARYPHSSVTLLRELMGFRYIEQWTFLAKEASRRFIELQEVWYSRSPDHRIMVSDVLRTIRSQIKLAVEKPRLAARPGSSLHGLGLAVDYDITKLGPGETFETFNKFLLDFEWCVHPRAFRSPAHHEAWHIQPLEFPGGFTLVSEYLAALRKEEGAKLASDEIEEIIEVVAGWMGIQNEHRTDKIRMIQRMVGAEDDGSVGEQTVGYLALLSLQYNKRSWD